MLPQHLTPGIKNFFSYGFSSKQHSLVSRKSELIPFPVSSANMSENARWKIAVAFIAPDLILSTMFWLRSN